MKATPLLGSSLPKRYSFRFLASDVGLIFLLHHLYQDKIAPLTGRLWNRLTCSTEAKEWESGERRLYKEDHSSPRLESRTEHFKVLFSKLISVQEKEAEEKIATFFEPN